MHAIGNGIMYGEQPAPVQEPVAWLFKDDWGRTKIAFSKETANEWGTEVQPLYTTPTAAQKPWVDLTGEEIMAAPENLIACIAYVRNKLREKNAAAQPAVQEHLPIAMKTHGAWDGLELLDDLPDGALLYTTSTAQKPWVGLTPDDKEFIELTGGKSDVLLAELIEAKLKALNYPTGNYPIVDN
jgi:hypothetical protein